MSAGVQLPPDPEQYDSERAQHARARGLDAPYIAGGQDPDLEATQERERRYLRWLLAMVAILVLSGFVVGAVGSLFQGG
jgi:hypothetical protein